MARALAPEDRQLRLLAAAIAGFLARNLRLPPLRDQARILMGDAGSMMLGLALLVSIDVSQGTDRSLPPMARVMFVRVRRRADLFDADREHLHHFLLDRGVAPHHVTLIVIGASIVSGAIGVGAWRLGVPEWMATYAFLALLAGMLASAYLAERPETSAEHTPGQ